LPDSRFDADHFWNFRQGNGAVSVIDYPQGPDGLPVLQAMNITTHLGEASLTKQPLGHCRNQIGLSLRLRLCGQITFISAMNSELLQQVR